MNSLNVFFRGVVATLALVASSLTMAADFAVSPMMIEMEAVPRATNDFSFTIFGRSDANIKLTLFDMNQLETGYMGFVAANFDSEQSMASWISLEDDRYRVRDGETIEVRGRINVPARAAGTYLLGVMVEEDLDEEDQSGIALRVRYAVVLNLRVEGTRNRRIQTSFEELAVVQQEDGTYLQGLFTNSSAVDEWLESQVQIRGEDNRLIERVEMKTESAWQRADSASRVFPGADVRVFGKLSKPVATGNYNVLVRNRFADKSQPVYRDTLRIEASDDAPETGEGESGAEEPGESVSSASLLPVAQLSPSQLDVEIRSNGTSLTSFYIVNDGAEEFSVRFPAELEDLAAAGISSFQFYPATVTVRPQQRTRVVLKQSHLEATPYTSVVFPAAIESASQGEQAGTLEIVARGGV